MHYESALKYLFSCELDSDPSYALNRKVQLMRETTNKLASPPPLSPAPNLQESDIRVPFVTPTNEH